MSGKMSLLMIATFACCMLSCHKGNTGPGNRTFRMGFQLSAPSPIASEALRAYAEWMPVADAAIISAQAPWDSLYAGVSPEQYVADNFLQVANLYRGANLKLWVYADPANGLNRAADAATLSALGKSIAQPGVQQLYARYCYVLDSMLQPDHMGVALEVNLIRSLSPDSVYQGVKNAANAAAARIHSYDSHVPLSISVQVDWAWGMAGNGTYAGIAQELSDFPFVVELGISSYPYFYFNNPEDIPINYYSRLAGGTGLPVFVSEGGWSSVQVGTYPESVQKQADYITRQGQLLDNAGATAVFQLTFTDINTGSAGATGLAPFAYIGLADTTLQLKPAFNNWKTLFTRQLAAGH